MTKLSVGILLCAASSLALAQDRPDPEKAATACEIRAYYLDKDDKPCDAKDVKASVIFETADGKKSRSYPMMLVKPAQAVGKSPNARHFRLEGTDYRFAVATLCTDATPPGGNTHIGKPFLKPLPIVVEPEGQKDSALDGAPYFKANLNQNEIQALQKGDYSDVYVVFTVYDKERKTKCFTCGESTSADPACARIAADLKTLETQVQAGEMDKAKVTMARVREAVAGLPATAGTEKARQDCAACCKELDQAIGSGDKEKALKEIKKLEARCEACMTPPPDAAPTKK
jgi:hypothetical protein